MLWQSDDQTGPRLNRQAGRYAHARQTNRMRLVIKRQRTFVGRLLRDTDRNSPRAIL